MNRLYAFLLFCLFTFFVFFPQNVYSMEGRVTPLSVEKNGVSVTIRVETDFDYDLEEIIFNGIPVRCLFDLSLYQQSHYWFDRELASLSVNHVLTYDNLKDIFVVRYGNDDKPPVEVDDLKEAELLACSIENLFITTSEELDPGKKYYVNYNLTITADAHSSNLPFYLEYLLKIFPWWDKGSD